MTILQKILDHKATLLPSMNENEPKFNIQQKKRVSLYDALRKTNTLQIISEMKRASPSKGLIAEGADPIEQAKKYENAGAICISVLTEEKFFKGSFEDLANVANTVDIPVLCKDFVMDPVQIDYAKAAGASVVLLIVAALDDKNLKSLYDYATNLKLDVLVEVHNAEELERALAIQPKIIGVNNRDLKTFNVDLAQTEQLAERINSIPDIAFISESGIWNSKDATRVASVGARGVLVGESLMRSGTVEETLRSFQVPLTESVVK
ncbi:indole-3-glycerol phosphate synthase [Lysinibacillus composti]|uniref:Indole-3-glycerol phosphate synthase n=1 Tax=Lysinibacillus composti TaxID=720633 RepID=A0A3N9USX6_9BACI|nr:indole-3-glycerol phosphate synthase TrpC [Lysinibacillus composti]MBM7609686.1 indole-3-glycerol phosphate synthase [Lysinibacillus composti]RQW75612.1 indole-3-glycerol phosphate synthase TrpC [Lysinibacillus composti]